MAQNGNGPVRGKHAAQNVRARKQAAQAHRKGSTQEFQALPYKSADDTAAGGQRVSQQQGTQQIPAASNPYSRSNYGNGVDADRRRAAANRADVAPAYGNDAAGFVSSAPAYESQAGGGKRAKKRGGAGKRVLIVILAIIVALLLAAGGFYLWFTTSLNKSLASAGATSAAVSEQLVSVPLDKPFYMLLMGSDSREGSGTGNGEAESGTNERSDVIMLARIDASSGKVTLVSVPRDTYYQLDDGTVVKINEMFNIDGPAGTIKAVSKLTGVDISHYAVVRVSQLQTIVDSLGGVKVNVDRPLSVEDTLTGEWISIDAGEQVLNGRQAQVFVRARHEYSNEGESQDVGRQNNVRTFVTALTKTVLNKPITEIPGTIIDLAQYVETDLNANDLISLGLAFVGKDLQTYSCTGPTEGAELVVNDETLWICYPNPEGWAALMQQVNAGQEPGEIDYVSTQVVF